MTAEQFVDAPAPKAPKTRKLAIVEPSPQPAPQPDPHTSEGEYAGHDGSYPDVLLPINGKRQKAGGTCAKVWGELDRLQAQAGDRPLGLKNARRVATRYDKTAESFLGFIDITSIRLWLRHLST